MRKLFLFVMTLLLTAMPALASETCQETSSAQEALMSGAITVKGEGASSQGLFTLAQKRIMALRAARTGALKEAAVILDGVTVFGETTVLNAAAGSDTVKTSAEGIVKGAVVVKEEYDMTTGAASVYLSVPMEAVSGAILPQLSSILPDSPMYNPALNATTGRYDGLVVDARGLGLKPALLNRLVTAKGEVIYDPSKSSQKALSEHGAAVYASDAGEAKGMLAKRGAVKPLVVKASAVARSTDAELGPIEAGAVFFSNRYTSFLESARVVFVLD